ncbi:MAG: hypothetical protein ACTS4V_01330 [Candidatus Hodgkinia cicadicola]
MSTLNNSEVKVMVAYKQYFASKSTGVVYLLFSPPVALSIVLTLTSFR